MKKRIKLRDRLLPDYTNGEEVMNMVTHIVGGSFGILALVLCLVRSSIPRCTVGAAIYGGSMIAIYAMSSIYHGLRPGMAKKVLQVLDHCAIYFLIAGSYSIVCLGAIRRESAVLGWGILGFEWALCILATVLTAIDLKRYQVFSMICYIGMGWAIAPFIGQIRFVLGEWGFRFLLLGGIAYTVGCSDGTGSFSLASNQ